MEKNQTRDLSIQKGLGLFLKQKRVESGLSKAEVAKYISASIPALDQMEQGIQPIPLNIIFALSNCLNICPDELLQRLGPKLDKVRR